MLKAPPVAHQLKRAIRFLGTTRTLAALQALLWTVPLGAQDAITLDDIRALPGTPWFAIAPDANRVAYLLSRPGAGSDLWLVPAGGGTAVQLTEGVSIRSVVGWNPGGTQLGYLSSAGEQTALWVLEPGTPPRIGCEVPRTARAPVWVGDGTRLSFAARVEPTGTNPGAGAPAAGEAVFMCDLPTGAVRRVTAEAYFGLDFGWAPAGDRLAVSMQERPGFYESLERDLLLVDPSTGHATPLVTRPGVDRSPMWSPDGAQVAFISGFGRSGLLPNLGVAVIRPGETTPRDIGVAHDRGGFFDSPALHAWSPDGQSVFYSVVDGLGAPLFQVQVADGGWAPVDLPVDDGVVAYQFSLAANGTDLAYKISSTDRPAEILTTRIGASRATRVTSLHDGFVAGLRRAERLRWSAPDSTIIEGILLRPPASAGPGPHPLVTILHGGPASAYNLSFPGFVFFNPYQDVMLAARGYAVFMPNPRGSGGYGEQFRGAVRRDWGYGPAADVQAGIDDLIASGVADSTRLALVGWSYGGYLAAWMLAQSDRFRVASVGAGVYDLTTHYGLGATQLEEYFGGPPWRLPGLYWQQSPIHHVARIRTPTQIIHGETDNAVSIAQSELLHVALLAEGVPTEFVRYPGEGHSLRQTATQDDSWTRLLTWLDRWLTVEPRRQASGSGGARTVAGAPRDDVTTLDGIIGAYYDVISGPAGTGPDRARDQGLHHPDALVAITGVRRDGARSIRTMSLDEYHEAFGGNRTSGFFEWELHREVQRFGNVAHVWSTYATSRETGGTPFARGINSIQLYHDGNRWWITSWIFDSERRDNPIPVEYLPAAP